MEVVELSPAYKDRLINFLKQDKYPPGQPKLQAIIDSRTITSVLTELNLFWSKAAIKAA